VDAHEEEDGDIMKDALEKEFHNMMDSLKGKPSRNSTSERNSMTEASVRISHGPGTTPGLKLNRKPPRPMTEAQKQELRIAEMEVEVDELYAEIMELQQSTALLPIVLHRLQERFMPELASAGAGFGAGWSRLPATLPLSPQPPSAEVPSQALPSGAELACNGLGGGDRAPTPATSSQREQRKQSKQGFFAGLFSPLVPNQIPIQEEPDRYAA